jgi:hypothetical protein
VSKGDAANVQPHPVLAALAGEASVVELQGYVAPAESGTLRLHMSLGTNTYVVIPEEAVLHVQESESEQGRVRVYVRGTAEVLVVRQRAIPAREFGAETDPARDALARVVRPPFLGDFGSSGFFDAPPSRASCIVDCTVEYVDCVVRQVKRGFPPDVAEDGCNRELGRCIIACRKKFPTRV